MVRRDVTTTRPPKQDTPEQPTLPIAIEQDGIPVLMGGMVEELLQLGGEVVNFFEEDNSNATVAKVTDN